MIPASIRKASFFFSKSAIELTDKATAPIFPDKLPQILGVNCIPLVVKLGTIERRQVSAMISRKSGCSRGSPPPKAT